MTPRFVYRVKCKKDFEWLQDFDMCIFHILGNSSRRRLYIPVGCKTEYYAFNIIHGRQMEPGYILCNTGINWLMSICKKQHKKKCTGMQT